MSAAEGTSAAGRPRTLADVQALLGEELIGAPGPDGGATLSGIAIDSRRVGQGDLFVAVPGVDDDGTRFVDDAVARGAAAVLTEADVDATVPVLRVRSARLAVARLASEWHGRPADRLSLVGVTGTVGKTTVVRMLESILTSAGQRPGVVGSLGAGYGEDLVDTGMTTPDPMTLHGALARIAERTDRAVMEVTSHALTQGRVHGLEFDLGIFTNLIMLEHLEYHGGFAEYVKAKLGFFDHVREGAPLIHPAGDRLVAEAVAQRNVLPVSCGSGADAVLHIERTAMTSRGTRLLFQLEKPLPLLEGGEVSPMTFPAALQLLGRAAVNNASLAAAAALLLGIDPETVASALADLTPPRRRMQVERFGGVTVLDDTVGHPDSVTGVFEVAENIPHDRLFVAYAVRGRRGAEINRRDAEAVGIWAKRVTPELIAVTSSEDAADERNVVESDERQAFVGALDEAGVAHRHHARLADAIEDVLERAGPGDLILLLGAQGMDDGLELVRQRLG